MAELKNGHLVREPEREPQPERDPRQLEFELLEQLELKPVVRGTFIAIDVEGDDDTVAAALQFAGALIKGGRNG